MSVVGGTAGGGVEQHVPRWRRSRIPVEYRWLGMDKRSFPWALAVVGLWLLWAVVLPRIDAAVDYDDEVQAGEQLAVTSDLAMTPNAGWDVVSGFRTGESPQTEDVEPVALTSGGLSFVVQTAPFDGTPRALLDQVNKVTVATGGDLEFRATGQRFTVKTDGGLTGVAEGFTTGRSDGILVGFVDDGTGIEVQITGPTAQLSARSDELTAMVESIGPRTSSSSAGRESTEGSGS